MELSIISYIRNIDFVVIMCMYFLFFLFSGKGIAFRKEMIGEYRKENNDLVELFLLLIQGIWPAERLYILPDDRPRLG